MATEIDNYLDNELTTLYLSTVDNDVLNKQQNRLRLSIIPSINKQLEDFSSQAFDTIEQEVYEELMRETPFESLTKEVEEHIKDRCFINYNMISLNFKRPNIGIRKIDVNEFDSYVKTKDISAYKSHLNDVYCNLRNFEMGMVRYKEDLKEFLEDRIPYLCRKYETLIYNNVKTFRINRSKNITVPNSLRLFIKSVFESILSI